MIKLTYNRWITLMMALLLENKYLYNIDDILRTEFQAQVRPLPEAYMLEYMLEFESPRQETVFRLKYSEYL